MDCPFCNIVEHVTERALRETEYTITLLSNPRLMPGHILVVPKRHVERLVELSPEERRAFFDEVIYTQERVLEKVSDGCDVTEHYRPFLSPSRLKVNHLHMHVRPRTLHDEFYQKVLVREQELFTDLADGEVERYRKLFF